MTADISYSPAAAPPSAAAREPLQTFPIFVMLAAVLFNAVLSYVNFHVIWLTPNEVIMAELGIVASAHLYAVSRYAPKMTLWYTLSLLLLIFAVYRMVTLDDYEVKYFRDFLLIATFVVLGMSMNIRSALTGIYVLQAIICVGVLWEGLALDSYADTLEIKQYYINTRFYTEEGFFNRNSKLFISATRPDARYFPFFDLHRMSSFYLEPVSLGNHVIIMTAVIVAFWREMSATTRLFMTLGTLLCLFACDGRLAATTSLLFIIVGIARPYIPKNFSLVYLPAAILFGVVAAYMFQFERGDDFPGRILHSVELLEKMTVMDVMGLSNEFLGSAVDSGLVYLILTQSAVGLALIWMVVVFGLEEDTPARQTYKNCLCLYLPLVMLVSNSLVSIKTGAPLWMMYGALVGLRAPLMSGVVARPSVSPASQLPNR